MSFVLPKFGVSKKGFTLVELIISMTVFTIFVGVISTVYVSVTRSLRHASEVRKVYAESRYIMDRITQDVRLYTIDYDCLEDSSDPSEDYGTSTHAECLNLALTSDGKSSTLPLVSSDGTHRVIYRFDASGDEAILEVLELDQVENADGSVDWETSEGYYPSFQTFVMDRTALENVQFVIWPLTSPYDHSSDNSAQYQPSVNVVIEAYSTSTVLPDTVNVMLQSTVSSRVYGTS